MAQKMKQKADSLHIPLSSALPQIDRSYPNKPIPQKSQASKLLNTSNPLSGKSKFETKKPTSALVRRESLRVFDRLNVSPIHHRPFQFKGSPSPNSNAGFQETSKNACSTCAIKVKKVIEQITPQKEEETSESMNRKLLELLEKLDEEKQAPNFDDYKDYLIYRLCRKVRMMMKGEKEKEGDLTDRSPTMTSNKEFIGNIRQKIEKSLFKIEMQLENEENDVTNEFNLSNQDPELAAKRAGVIEKLKKNIHENDSTYRDIPEKMKDELENPTTYHEIPSKVDSCNEKPSLNGVNSPEDPEIATKRAGIIEKLKKNMQENDSKMKNELEDHTKYYDKRPGINECSTQTETFSLETGDFSSVKYPSDLLASSLRKLQQRKHIYERLDQDNDALLRGFTSNTQFLHKTPTKTSPRLEISEIDSKGGGLSYWELKYSEILELMREKAHVSSHSELISKLETILLENRDLQTVYLDFKRQVLKLLIPELPNYETRSAGEILELISQLIEENRAFLMSFNGKTGILARINEEMGVVLESEDALMRLLLGMSRDLGDLQYQCKIIAGMLDMETSIDMREVLDSAIEAIKGKNRIYY